jgi:cell division protein FtsL
MSGEAFEYSIKKDIRNNPIVREVDRERHRDIFSAWQHFELQQHGYKYEQMLQQRAEEELVNRHLRLEVETLKAPARIERVAMGRLKMVAPTPADSTVIERVAPAPAPPPSVVARR